MPVFLMNSISFIWLLTYCSFSVNIKMSTYNGCTEGGPNKRGGWNIRQNQKKFDKIKGKGLFVNEIRFYH